ncbi:MAG: PKD domain-containing protein [Candidatus Bipolaricaulota bacterium]|nr:PKD domain-containing protein [Candidatus Bipolaricaulota bacterium]
MKEVAFAAGPPPVVVVYRPPVADFTWEPRPARAGQPVTFDARPSLGAIVRYRWEFTGDGIPDGEGAQAVWTFPEPRLYLVTLEVEDDEGGTDRVTLLVPVEP